MANMKIERKHTKTLFLILLTGSIFLLVYSIFLYSQQVFAQSVNETPTPQITEAPKESVSVDIRKEQLIAKSYVIYDVYNKRIVRSENSFSSMPLASLTKVITVGTFLATAKKNKIELKDDTKLRIQKALVQSSNSDADSLGEIYHNSFGQDLLNDSNSLLKSMGIGDTYLTNLTGLDNEDGTASNIGSAESIAKVFAFMYENYREVFEYTMFNRLETNSGVIQNTNRSTDETFGILASKTGFTYEAGGNLGVVVSPEPGSAYVVLVMNSTKEGRFEDVKKLVKLLPLLLNERN
jgi:D-alanyl-D-alanine carboxypeptidase